MASSTTTITTPTTALSLSTVLTTSQPPCLHRRSPSTSYFSVKLSPSKLKSLKFSSFYPKILPPYVVSASSSDTSAGNSDYVSVPIEKCFPSFPTVLDINEIRAILPHRFPFLLVDRVVEYNPGVTAVAIKNVTINDNFFPGHFPQRPIMPGVLMVEAMAQVGGLVVLKQEVGGPQANFFFAGIDKVRFRKPVIAGDTLVMRMTLIKLQKRFGIAKMEGKAYVGGELVCEGEFLMAMAGDSRE